MEIVELLRGDVTVLRLRGALDYGTSSGHVEAVLNRLVKHGRVRVVIDLREVSHVDTTCLGLLIATYLKLRRLGGGVVLLNTPRRIHQILSIAKLDRVLLTFAMEEEAVAAFPMWADV
jgi:anti-sigma B factor antagonist